MQCCRYHALHMAAIYTADQALIQQLIRADAASNAEVYEKVKNGVDLCDEAEHQKGGPSTPLYNYASASRISDPLLKETCATSLRTLFWHMRPSLYAHLHLMLQAMAQTGRVCARPEQPSPRLTFPARTVSEVRGVPALYFLGLQYATQMHGDKRGHVRAAVQILQIVVIPLSAICFASGAASSLSAINSTSTTIAFGTMEVFGNAVMRLAVDEVELISGNWTKSGFTIPVCGALSKIH